MRIRNGVSKSLGKTAPCCAANAQPASAATTAPKANAISLTRFTGIVITLAASGTPAIDATNTDAAVGLGYALLRQDRKDEAIQTLQDLLARTEHPAARALLTRLQKMAAQEKDLAEERRRVLGVNR